MRHVDMYEYTHLLTHVGRRVTLTSNTQVAYWPPNTGAVNYLGQVVMTAALASDDIVAGSIMYEATA